MHDSSGMKTKFTSFKLALFTPALIALGALAFMPPARGEESKLTKQDKSFITNASEAGNAEIAKAKLADKSSSDADIKAFADMMIKDHSKANDELATIVEGKAGKVSKGPGAAQDAKILELKALSGEAFDKAYAKQAVADHKEAVALFEKASTDLDDADLKAFAEKTLPTLKHHLEEAEKLDAKFNK